MSSELFKHWYININSKLMTSENETLLYYHPKDSFTSSHIEIVLTWRWRRHVLQNLWKLPTRPRSIISRKTTIHNFTPLEPQISYLLSSLPRLQILHSCRILYLQSVVIICGFPIWVGWRDIIFFPDMSSFKK